MTQLLNISFEHSIRMPLTKEFLSKSAIENGGIFVYQGREFKIFFSEKNKNSLLTIAKSKIEEQEAYSMATEFLSAIAFQNDSVMLCSLTASHGWEYHRLLEEANVFYSEQIELFSNYYFDYFKIIPYVATSTTQDKSVRLYRQANAARNIYLKFLFYYHILSLGYAKDMKKVGDRIYNIMRKTHNDLYYIKAKEAQERLKISNKDISLKLMKNNRDAIGHIERNKENSKQLIIDNLADEKYFRDAVCILKFLVRYKINKTLRLNQKRMDLMKDSNGKYYYELCKKTKDGYIPESLGVYWDNRRR